MLSVGALLVLLALQLGINADGIYTKNSPVLQVSGDNYASLIAQSNHTSIVEFYAPWCGHCQKLKPAYEKAARSLTGLAKVAAVNCDDEANKPFCGSMGVQGFPTLKIVKPGTKPGRPIVEDYQGQRTVKAIVDAVVDKIPNHVKRLKDNELSLFLSNSKTTAKALLFSEKATTAALIKALAVDYLGSITFGQMRATEIDSVEKYGVSQFPTFVLIPETSKEPILYAGEMKRESLLDFFSQVATPNPDPAPKKAKAAKSSKTSKDSKSASTASSAFSKASKAHKADEYADFLNDASTVILEDGMPTKSPNPIVPPAQTPIAVEDVKPIPILASPEDVKAACLTPKSGNCILVLLPAQSEVDAVPDQQTQEILDELADITSKYNKRGAKVFPFYGISADNAAAKVLRNDLGLRDESALEVLATNAKRGWWSAYAVEGSSLDSFVDAIRFGHLKKERLPDGFVTEEGSAKDSPPVPVPEAGPEPVVDDDQSSAKTDPPSPEPVSEPEAEEPQVTDAEIPVSEADAELEAKAEQAFSSIENVASPVLETDTSTPAASTATEHDEL